MKRASVYVVSALLLGGFSVSMAILSALRPPDSNWTLLFIAAGIASTACALLAFYAVERRLHQQVRHLQALEAASAKMAEENARLYQQKSHYANQLGLLNQVSSLLSRNLSDEVLSAAVSSAGMISDANAVALFLAHEQQDGFVLILQGEVGIENAQTVPLSRFQRGLERIERLIIADILQDERALAVRALGKRGLVEIPMYSNDAPVGLLAFYYDAPIQLAQEQLDLMETYVAQVAQAIQNVQVHGEALRALQQRLDQLSILAILGRQLSAEMDDVAICQALLSYALESVSAADGAIVLYNDRAWRVMAKQGFEGVSFSHDFEQGAWRRVLIEGEVVHLNKLGEQASEQGAYTPLKPNTQSVLIVPLLKGDEVLGALLLESTESELVRESSFLMQMLRQGAIALNNAQLFNRVSDNLGRLQIILDAIEEAMILIDLRGMISMANPHVTLLGLEPHEILYHSLEVLLEDEPVNFAQALGFSTPEDAYALLDSMKQSNWQIPPPYSFSLETRGKVRILQRQILPLRDEAQNLKGLMLFFYDKTEEDELARSRETFTQMLVHDLKSPLSAVTTSLRLLQELVPHDVEYYPLVEKMTEISRRAIKTVLNRVESILDVGKLESGEGHLNRELVPVRQLIDNARTEVLPIAQELEVEIKVDIEGHLPLLDVDADKTERIILNLLDNALKYSPAERQVLVRARRYDENSVRLEIIDQGQGIPDEYKQRIFDRYVQVAGRPVVRRGVGLGLAFCRLATEAQGGRIWIEDNPEGGSSFCVTLPIAAT